MWIAGILKLVDIFILCKFLFIERSIEVSVGNVIIMCCDWFVVGCGVGDRVWRREVEVYYVIGVVCSLVSIGYWEIGR